jgi:hypothetical protein
MIKSLVKMILGCAHNKTTFPLTPLRNSKVSGEARRGTYIVCLDCGKEFAYDWKEMRIGKPTGELSVSPSVLHTGQTAPR